MKLPKLSELIFEFKYFNEILTFPRYYAPVGFIHVSTYKNGKHIASVTAGNDVQLDVIHSLSSKLNNYIRKLPNGKPIGPVRLYGNDVGDVLLYLEFKTSLSHDELVKRRFK
jgi:hypothetical protein